jgi:hypothetical protein
VTRRASRIAAAAGALAFAATLLGTLLHSEPRYAGSNAVRAVQIVQPIPAGTAICQKGEIVPAGASTVEVSVGTGGQSGPPFSAELRDRSGRVVARGRAPGGYTDGLVAAPIPTVRRTLEKVDVCLRASARGPAQLYGQPNAEGKLEVGGRGVPGVLRIAYKRPGSETWLALAPTIAHRFAQAKTRIATPLTFWLLGALVLGAAGLAVGAVLRDDEDEALA